MSDTPTPSRVVKFPLFTGSLANRALYIYLPPGYDDNPDTTYPVLYMHDGQNVFEAYAGDSYVGSWRADESADKLIRNGRMQPIIIVGVSHGRAQRMAEYLPPYLTLRRKSNRSNVMRLIQGRADKLAHYYMEDVAGFVRSNFRVRPGRENTATCGSSMGGLLSAYFAWEYPEFARAHAIVSPAFWLTYNQEGSLEMHDRMNYMDRPDVRLWLDSGTKDSSGGGDDGKKLTIQARDVLLKKGFTPGEDFHYFLDEGAIHNESAWANRLPKIFEFLFPGENASLN